jgi:hypothetical protein
MPSSHFNSGSVASVDSFRAVRCGRPPCFRVTHSRLCHVDLEHQSEYVLELKGHWHDGLTRGMSMAGQVERLSMWTCAGYDLLSLATGIICCQVCCSMVAELSLEGSRQRSFMFDVIWGVDVAGSTVQSAGDPPAPAQVPQPQPQAAHARLALSVSTQP